MVPKSDSSSKLLQLAAALGLLLVVSGWFWFSNIVDSDLHADGLPSSVIAVNDNNAVEEIFQSKVPVLIDFYASWCGPCRIQSPVIEKLSKQYDGKVKFVKVNIDEAPILAETYRIQAVPTLYIFSSKPPANASTVGLQSEQQVRSFIGNTLRTSIADVSPQS